MIIGYLDPASGSAVVGAVAAGLGGVGVAAKTLLAKMRRRQGSAEQGPDAQSDTSNP